ncbi:MAG TPA: hypothetical protein DCS07_15340 [Bdellovibrionales bacterium]|nr:MAG: hypothetical protein A2Z97_03250 [Bdellovibrionales bacterium GWB1_52_6]OFZ02889.1 MAG: hypothetical protein A2X97_04775 [Bdellovibrionales bacterium GWA1_52_35]OFZ44018.1 MAG: hypothetical protein A2070_06440 [Bdellovibrionales bacterium GWC1_52_8]HAR43984.1 hypothetical protein [Bdellovibrionales bacterium]HCM38472.1 hypothetical protein [Bdellovibrionales bacterium]
MADKTPDSLRHTVVLTSRENFVWHSMQEIIPALEQLWVEAARPERHRVSVLNADEASFSKILQACLSADQIVFTCFTVKLARIGQLLREKCSLDCRYILYLHQLATIGCWPLHEWGLAQVLRSSDLFLSSCRKDADTLKLSFASPDVRVLPFTIFDFPETRTRARASFEPATPVSLIYAGRISAQKNLHTLLQALSLLALRRPELEFKLDIYGSEDNLGSPNMGLESRGYALFLTELNHRLGLEHQVRFGGMLPREALHERLWSKPCIFISPSLHSDENFGMAAFRSLCLGNLAVLSDWGGHADFDQCFPGQVFYAPVRESSAGPFIHPEELSALISEASKKARTGSFQLPANYTPSAISEALLKIALEPKAKSAPLQATDTSRALLANRKHYLNDSPKMSKIFASYEDPLAKLFFRAYGMIPKPATTAPSPLALVPWAQRENGEITIVDPHRGNFSFSNIDKAAEYGFAHHSSC